MGWHHAACWTENAEVCAACGLRHVAPQQFAPNQRLLSFLIPLALSGIILRLVFGLLADPGFEGLQPLLWAFLPLTLIGAWNLFRSLHPRWSTPIVTITEDAVTVRQELTGRVRIPRSGLSLTVTGRKPFQRLVLENDDVRTTIPMNRLKLLAAADRVRLLRSLERIASGPALDAVDEPPLQHEATAKKAQAKERA